MRSTRFLTLATGLAAVAGAAMLAAAYFMASTRGVPLSDLTYDTTSVLDAPVYVGSVARLTMMVWAAVAGAAMVAALVAHAYRVPLACLAALTLIMALDDAMRLHEGVGPRIGIPEVAFYVFYAVVAGGLLLWFARRRPLASIPYLLGGVMMAASVLIDVLFDDDSAAGTSDVLVLLEDGSKLLGALFWLCVPPILVLERPTTSRPADLD